MAEVDVGGAKLTFGRLTPAEPIQSMLILMGQQLTVIAI
jgi:hypothetical protein